LTKQKKKRKTERKKRTSWKNSTKAWEVKWNCAIDEIKQFNGLQ